MMPRAGRVAQRARMPRKQRLAIYLIVGTLWLSGCLWWYLDEFRAVRGPFGAAPHPFEPPLLLFHGIDAILSMYLLGWITSRHILRWWPGRVRRLSGATLAASLAILVLSGFALFFLSEDRSQHIAALIHEVLGVAVSAFALQHWLFRKQRVI